MLSREPKCSVGYGGDPITGWRLTWLPKGYGPTPEDRLVCVVADPVGEEWHDGYTFNDPHPLIAVIRDAITAYYTQQREA